MKHDLQNRADIELLVNCFYDKVKQDETIGYLFNDVAKVNWEKHLPVMYSFWENIIFYTSNYQGNPMDAHTKLNQQSRLKMQHFQQWNKLFAESVDQLFEGEKAELIKQRALSISTVMQIKIFS
jgi:hemoglobin